MDDIVKEATELLEETKQAWREIYDLAAEDIEFCEGKQWNPTDIVNRGTDRPSLTINRMPQFTNQVINNIRQNTPTIKVLPVDSEADPKTAEMLQDYIRNIEKVSKADAAYDTAVDYAVRGSIGWIRVDHDYIGPDTFEQQIIIKRVVDWASVYIDPSSVEPDGRDSDYGFVLEQIHKDKFRELYPDADEQNFSDELNKSSFAASDKYITIAEYFKKESEEKEIALLDNGLIVFTDQLDKIEGSYSVVSTRKIKKDKVKRSKMTGAEELEKTTFPSSYVPLIPVYGAETWIKGKRHLSSLIRHAKDPQRMHNAWASLETELIMDAPRSPWIIEAGTTEGFDAEWKNPSKHKVLRWKAKNINGQPANPPRREPPTPIPTAVVNARMGTVDDMKAAIGMFEADLGQESNEKSGKAILAKQQQGATSTFHFGDNLVRSIGHVGVIILDMIPQVIDTPRLLRTIGEDGSAKSIPVNGQAPTDPNDQSMLNSRNQIHDIRVGKYDIAVTTGPSYANKRQEGAQALMELSQSNPIIAQAAPDLLVEQLDIPGAATIAKRIKKALPPQLVADEDEQQSPEVAQLQGALQQMQAEAQQAIGELQQENQKLTIDNQNKQGEIQVKAKQLELKDAELGLKQVQMQMEQQNNDKDRQADLMKAQIDAEIKAVIERMKSEAAITQEQIRAEAAVKQSDNQTYAELNKPQENTNGD